MENFEKIKQNLSKYRLDFTEINALAMMLIQLKSTDRAYLFGSRLDLNATGGDIDILILSNTKQYDYVNYLKSIFQHHCHEKIDIILINLDDLKESDEVFIKTLDSISKNLITDENDYPLTSLMEFKTEHLRKIIEKSIKALERLETAVKELDNIDLNKPLGETEMLLLDGEFIRFQRAYETIIYFFKTYERYIEGSSSNTLRDTLLLMEKIGFIKNIDIWLDMRKLRNQIAHIYLDEFLNITTKITVTRMAHVLVELKDKLLDVNKNII